MPTLLDANDHAQRGDYAKAWPVVTAALNAEPYDPRAICLATFMLERQGQPAMAYLLAKQLVQSHSANPTAWVNLGKCADTLWRMDEAEAAYRRALSQVRAGDSEIKVTIFTNLSALYLQRGQFREAERFADYALQLDAQHLKSRHNKGLCLLAAGRWAEGWGYYEASVGSPSRVAWNYTGEPTWRGEPGKTVVVFGEQGLGDEICAASMFGDAIERAGRLIIDCDARLATLFRRSFPRATVYGTRADKVIDWAEADRAIDYSIASMQLGGLFRTHAQAFHGEPYLVSDPDRVLMWRALWRAKGRPAVGLAWTGGLAQTGAHLRSVTPEQLAPILGMDCTFVSLQYRDAGAEIAGTPIVQYPDVLLRDYDHTAALVASLDAVVSVPTTVAHLAGALGVPTVAMHAQASCWKYTAGLPFHPCTLIQNNGWPQTIAAAAKVLHELLAR